MPTNDKKTADEMTLKMDLMIDIIEILNKFKIEDISTDKLLDIYNSIKLNKDCPGEACDSDCGRDKDCWHY